MEQHNKSLNADQHSSGLPDFRYRKYKIWQGNWGAGGLAQR